MAKLVLENKIAKVEVTNETHGKSATIFNQLAYKRVNELIENVFDTVVDSGEEEITTSYDLGAVAVSVKIVKVADGKYEALVFKAEKIVNDEE